MKHLRLFDEVIGSCGNCKNLFFFTIEVRGDVGTLFVPPHDGMLVVERGRVLHERIRHPSVGFLETILLARRAPKPIGVQREHCGELAFSHFHPSQVRWLDPVSREYGDAETDVCEAVMQASPVRRGK